MKIGICGSHGVGKTTLMKLLKKEMPTINLVTEAARECPYPINEKTGFQSQEWIFREQVRRELSVPIDDITISDRTVYDQLAYITYAYEHGNITYEECRMLERFISYWGFTYDYIIYVPIEFDMEKDGVRSENEEYRKEIDEVIRDLLEDYVCDERRCTVTGTPEQRLAKVKEVLMELSVNKQA
jgi:deoxyadenosine/deoxycytidine kinase